MAFVLVCVLSERVLLPILTSPATGRVASEAEVETYLWILFSVASVAIIVVSLSVLVFVLRRSLFSAKS